MIGCIIQARMDSSRLPGKSMMKLNKKPVLYHVLNQVKNCKKIDKIIVATTNKKEDNKICDFVRSMKIVCFRGKSLDVLDRYYSCAKKYSLSTIVRITADNPLIDPIIIDSMIERFNRNRCDIATNSVPRTFPYGTEVEVFSFKALETIWKKTLDSIDREHVTSYFYRNPKNFKILNVTNKQDLSNYRWTLDEKADFNLIEQLVLKIPKDPILMEDILKILKNNPKLIKLNKMIRHKEINTTKNKLPSKKQNLQRI